MLAVIFLKNSAHLVIFQREAVMPRHTIAPLFDCRAETLILGSFPSVKSREAAFYYAHPQNRFWRVMAAVLDCAVPETAADKREMLLSHRIALWDVIASCELSGSADASITQVVPNDLTGILSRAPIRRIYTNGGKATALYRKYLLPQTGIPSVALPSTSPANAGYSLERLIDRWRQIALPPRPEL
jgi:TDG/mug DNA glycosylase family protein